MAKRQAHTSWRGGLMDGTGRTTLVSSGAGEFEVSFPRRTADEAEGVTSPEELIGAAHSACYSMALSSGIAKAGGTPIALEVDATVSLDPDPAGGSRISQVHLRVVATLEGLDAATFQGVAEAAKAGCPVSKALTGTAVTLEASLAE
ncbi:MAG: OsmC family peroxiredoxin [Acidobacteriota bacterium]|nr:OsmC family peroxiredoxin [Acidobacteriota bacterium]